MKVRPAAVKVQRRRGRPDS